MAKAKKQSPADALISQKNEPSAADPSPEAIVELEKLVAHNRGLSGRGRVGRDSAIAMIADNFGWIGGRDSFDKFCVRQWGATWTKI